MTTSREVEYVRRLLQMNPLEQTTEILTLRRDFLHPQENSTKRSVTPVLHHLTTTVNRLPVNSDWEYQP
ncbi:hypothetical protein [uncultured Gimesia sp.]|uniref:hypothetical protein n=1 Tax=uncultured Gimesia sp. TaxID=1678688 RepID=UPI0030D8A3C5|tara:strand:- start:49043 stop:49249 length:207 start_codon:yes stop_codon:yes gene_type:complete